MNKIYTVGHKCSEHVNIVVASSSKEAKLIGMNYEWTQDVDYLDLRVKAVKGGNGFYNEYPEFEFHISGKGFIYTNLQPHSMDWEDFISELERQERLVFETGLFECFHSYDDEYFGLKKKKRLMKCKNMLIIIYLISMKFVKRMELMYQK